MSNNTAPTVSDHYIELPDSTLHYVKSGHGPPLIMVPATISRIEQWLGLAQFMGTKFTTHFFELPGHGKSTQFKQNFSSELMAKSIEDFIDELGYQKVTLMGFSFGGILAIKALQRLQERVERVVLIAPCVTKRALLFSPIRKWMLRTTSAVLQTQLGQDKFLALLHSKTFERSMIAAVKVVARPEDTVPLDKSFHKMPRSTVAVLAYQLAEVMHLEHPALQQRYSQPLHFAMSVNDPLMDFTTTYDFLDGYFSNISSLVTTFPYHQPPKQPTFDELKRDYSQFLATIS